VAGLAAAYFVYKIYPPHLKRGGKVVQLLLKIIIILFKDFRQIPVFINTKDRESLAKTILFPKKVLSEAINETKPIVLITYGVNVLPPAVLIGFIYKTVSSQ